ncbi:hypothetical protein BK816_05200 [Boudabousia tangfeifanii]|uniref:Carrier domain-containing protein n=1 Tax=Boudabousia tangfeifanii TaxID=1912795 RepID=A0A1D9MKF7_9ACTO|nr:acyl carrier protein [Boudabousia tangfeifanii]AOZ72762.1 hypothetical protein BK816_05200 [Boudabousia tangfeifanii]
MAGLEELAALKAALEAEADPMSQDEDTPDDPIEGGLTAESQAEQVATTESQKEEVVRILLPHLAIAPEEMTPALSLTQAGLGKIARWTVATAIEQELKITLPDSEILNWKTLEDIFASIENPQI